MKILVKATCIALLFFLSNQPVRAQFNLSVGINIRTAPPPLPFYTHPPCPVEGYLWTPGYWAYDEIDEYFWVPGVWVRPPFPGHLWTPGYWGFNDGFYGWNSGYWGYHIGFYGGINYGYGYGGSGFYGGEWRGNAFHYNTAVVNVNREVVHNTYINNTVINNTTINNTTVNNRMANKNASFNGSGGVAAQPNEQERTALKESHVQPTTEQLSHNQNAKLDRKQFAKFNNGRPATTAMNTVDGKHFNHLGNDAPKINPRPVAGFGKDNQPINKNKSNISHNPNTPLSNNAKDAEVKQQNRQNRENMNLQRENARQLKREQRLNNRQQQGTPSNERKSPHQ